MRVQLHLLLVLALLWGGLLTTRAAAQVVALVPIVERVQVESANERSTLDRRTRILTSTVDLSLRNISAAPVAGPVHLVLGLNGQNLQLVQAPGALGGIGQPPYNTFYYDLSAQLAATGGQLAPGASVQLHVELARPSNVAISYTATPYGPADTLDSAPPDVSLQAPAQVLVGTTFTVTASARDNVGVTRLEFYVNDVKTLELSEPPFDLPLTAPANPGQQMHLRAEAFDAAGNQGSASADVVAVEGPDNSPPQIIRLDAPPQAAPGETVRIHAEAIDDRGVARVEFAVASQPAVSVPLAPYDIDFTVPVDAGVGQTLPIVATAFDASGNTGTTTTQLLIVELPDGEPPNPVTLSAPAQALAGELVSVSSTALDNVGVSRIEFRQQGVLIGTDYAPPFALEARIPAAAQVGELIRFDAAAYDFAGNRGDAATQSTEVVAPGDGAFEGAVFDDATGQPLTDALIELSTDTALNGPGPRLAMDEHGQFRQLAGEGIVRLRFSKPGYSSVWRRVEIAGGVINHVFSPRLTPLAPALAIDNAFGGSIGADENRVTLFANPGALGEAAQVSLSRLSGQGLPGLLPAGWAPASAWLIGPDALTFNSPLELRIKGAGNLGADPQPASLIAVRWDADHMQWVRQAHSALEGGGVLTLLDAPGTIALVVPDSQPATPPQPGVGQPLEGVSLTGLAEGAALEIQPSPEILFMQPGARSQVRAVLAQGGGVPSGVPVQVDFNESYLRTDQGELTPRPMLQDFVLYQRGSDFEAQFNVSPSRQFDPALLARGVINLLAHRPGEGVGQALIGPSGGTVQALDGSALVIPPGALGATLPIDLRSATAPGALGTLAGATLLGGIEVDLGGTSLTQSARWTFPTSATLGADAQVLALREVEIQGLSRFELVGLAEVDGQHVHVGAGQGELPLPGITRSGRYYLVRMDAPVGFVTGRVTGPGGSVVQQGVMSLDSLPFVSLIDMGDPLYVLAGLLGPQAVSGLDLTNGAGAAGAATLATRGASVVLNLEFSAGRPTVSAVLPSDGAQNADPLSTVRVTFSRAMNPATITPAGFQVRAGDVPVTGTVALQPDGRTAVFQPAAALAGETLHRVVLTSAVADSFGNALFGNQADGSFTSLFTTRDVTPPPRPEPGQIHMSLPDEDGVVTLTGTIGAAPPGAVVTILNNTTGGATAVIANADGSFTIRFIADILDSLSLELRDAAGNVTTVAPGLFDGGDGNVVVGQAGGTVTLPDGSTFTFAEGSFAGPSRVSIERFEENESPVPPLTDAQLVFAAGLRIDTHGAQLLKPLKFRINHPDPLPTDRPMLVARLDDVGGEKVLVLIESANYIDGAIQVNSPPFPGVFGYMVAASPIMIFVPALLSNISFVTGEVIKAPPVGSLSVTVDAQAGVFDSVIVSATANAVPPGANVTNMKILREDGTELANGVGPSLSVSDSIDTSLLSAVGSWVKFILLGQQKQTWIATADIQANGKTFHLRTSVATEIVVTGEPVREPLRQSTASEFDRVTEGASRPAVGAYIEIFNGLATSYPMVTQTNALGRFVLAAATGSGEMRVFDPLTGQGIQIPIEVPTVIFDFLDVGTVFVPEGFGDGLPPTLDVSVSGQFEPGQTFTIQLNATDNEKLERSRLKIQGEHFASEFPIENPFSKSYQYTAQSPGNLSIEAEVFDSSGNSARRETIVRISNPEATGVSVQPQGSTNTFPDNAENMPLRFGSYIPIGPLAGGSNADICFALEDLASLQASYTDPVSGQTYPATGGVMPAVPNPAGGGASEPPYLYIEPLYPLPPGTELQLNVNGSTTQFSTAGYRRGKILPGFTSIRGVAQYGRYVYVADFTEASDGIKIVDMVNPDDPKIVGGFPIPGGARGVDINLDQLAVIGGGGQSLPILRTYSLADPVQPERTANCVLFPLEDQAIPTIVKLSGDVAYVGTIGAGVQAVDLARLRQINAIPFAERKPEERNGAAAIIGGFRLPNPETSPPLIGSPFGLDFGLSGLALTGGSSNRLYVLANTVGGFLSSIPLASGNLWYDLPFSMQRVAASNDLLVRADINGDGKLDLSNRSIAAVSHGSNGISIHDLTNPAVPVLKSTLAVPDSVFDMEILEGFIFTANRVATVFDPSKPAISSVLKLQEANGNSTPLTAGADLAISVAFPISGADERLVLMTSSDASRTKLQAGMLSIPGRDRDWDIIRTGPLEPRIHPDNIDYLNTGDPVEPFTGEFTQTVVDMAVEGRGMDFEFTRTYRSRNDYDGPMGFGWELNYNDRLTVAPVTDLGAGDLGVIFQGTGNSFGALEYGDITRYDGSGRIEKFALTAGGYSSPPGVFAEMTQKNDELGDYFELEMSDGTVHTYRPAARAPWTHFRLDKIEDRFGNKTRLKYNRQDQLVTIRDTMGRDFTLTYDDKGRIVALTDYSGRRVEYEYDGAGNICDVISPATTDFPEGRATHYTYSGGFAEFSADGEPLQTAQLNHNLTSITDPNGSTYLRLEYYPDTNPASPNFDRVRTQTLGEPNDPTYPSGGTYTYQYAAGSATTTNREQHETHRFYDGDGNLERIEEQVLVRGVLKNNITRMKYHSNGLMESYTSPAGVVTEYSYSGGANPRRAADLTQIKITPPGGGTARTWAYTIGAYGTPSSITDPANHTTQFTVGATGLVQQTRFPTTQLADGSFQTITESATYGANGELLSTTNGEGLVIRYAYYGNTDPNGDGDSAETLPASIEDELDPGPGYLRSITFDSPVGGTVVLPGAASTTLPPPANLKTQFKYDAVGNRKQVTDPRNTVTNYTFNTNNELEMVTEPRGTRRFKFDGNGSVIRVEDLADRVMETEYDALGLVRKQIESGPGVPTRMTALNYDGNENMTRLETPLKYANVMTYDERQLVVEERTEGGSPNPVNGVLWRLQYDEDGNLVRRENAEGNAWIFAYNGFNEVIGTRDPNGNQSELEYDPRGLVRRMTLRDAQNQVVRQVTLDLDEKGRIRSSSENVVLPGQGTQLSRTQFIYDKSDRVVQTTDALGRADVTRFDRMGRVIYQRDAAGNEVERTYSGPDLEFVIERFTASGGTKTETRSKLEHDPLGRLTKLTSGFGSADERTQTFTHDSRDNITDVVEAGGVSAHHVYDAFNRLLTSSMGTMTEARTYDADNRVLTMLDALGHGVSLEYDGRNRLVSRTYADGSRETYTYHPDNEIQTLTDRAGNVLTYVYDAGNRMNRLDVTRAAGFAGVTQRRYGYDAQNRIVSYASESQSIGTWSVSHAFNDAGMLLEQIQQGQSVKSASNLAGERTGLTYPANALDLVMQRSPNGNLKRIGLGGQALLELDYFGPMLRSRASYGNGTSAERSFNGALEEIGRVYRSPQQALQTGFTLGRDGAGRLIGAARTHANGVGETFGYTPEGWMNTARFGLADPIGNPSDVATAEFSLIFDAAANWKQVNDQGSSRTLTVNALNQILNDGQRNYTFDANGNLTSDGQRRFEYSAFGELVRVSQVANGAEIVRYEYDALGRRVMRTAPSSTEKYIYDGGDLIQVVNSQGQPLRQYVHSEMNSHPELMRTAQGDFYYQHDYRGSISALTDATGAVVERYTYDAWGQVSIVSPAGQPLTASLVGNEHYFSGAWLDPATGLLHMGARDYNPALGRFLQSDPARTIDGLNLYAYAGNDPVNYSDPTGLYRQALAENMHTGHMLGAFSILTGLQLADAILTAGAVGRGFNGRYLPKLDRFAARSVEELNHFWGSGAKMSARMTARSTLRGATSEARAAVREAAGRSFRQGAGMLDDAVADAKAEARAAAKAAGRAVDAKTYHKISDKALDQATQTLLNNNLRRDLAESIADTIKNNKEQGGTIFRRPDGSLYMVRAAEGVKSSIPLKNFMWKPLDDADVLVGSFHTHPSSSPASAADLNVFVRGGLGSQHYILSKKNIYVIETERTASGMRAVWHRIYDTSVLGSHP